MDTLVIADVQNLKVWALTTPEKAQEELARAKAQNLESIATWEGHCKKYPERDEFKTYLKQEKQTSYEVISYSKYLSIEREKRLGIPMKEITEEKYNEMLDVLPPLHWVTHNNVEMFCNREMYSGTYTEQYAHDLTTGKYYSKMVDSADPQTWICELLR